MRKWFRVPEAGKGKDLACLRHETWNTYRQSTAPTGHKPEGAVQVAEPGAQSPTSFVRKHAPPLHPAIAMLLWPWAKLERRAVCAERCTYGSGRRSAKALLTPLWTSEGWLYLAVILDLYSRRVIGWAVSNRMKRDLAIQALDMAAALRQPPKGCIHHTDRGSQYCSHDYQKKAQEIWLPCIDERGKEIVMIMPL